jgi:hypothetical protein
MMIAYSESQCRSVPEIAHDLVCITATCKIIETRSDMGSVVNWYQKSLKAVEMFQLFCKLQYVKYKEQVLIRKSEYVSIKQP